MAGEVPGGYVESELGEIVSLEEYLGEDFPEAAGVPADAEPVAAEGYDEDEWCELVCQDDKELCKLCRG